MMLVIRLGSTAIAAIACSGGALAWILACAAGLDFERFQALLLIRLVVITPSPGPNSSVQAMSGGTTGSESGMAELVASCFSLRR